MSLRDLGLVIKRSPIEPDSMINIGIFVGRRDEAVFDRADEDNDQKAMAAFFDDHPEGDWLKIGWEGRTEYRRQVYG